MLVKMHFHYLSTFWILASSSLTSATPSKGRKTCTIKASGTNKTDDAPAIRSAFSECSRRARIVFNPTTYYVNSVLNITGLEDVEIDILGTLLVRRSLHSFHAHIIRDLTFYYYFSGVQIFLTGSTTPYPWATKTNPQPLSSAATTSRSTATAQVHSTATATTGTNGYASNQIRPTIPVDRIRLLSTDLQTRLSRALTF